MKKDKIFMAVYFAFCIVISFFTYFFHTEKGSMDAVIYRDGERIASISLEGGGDYTFADIGYTVAVEEGKAFIKNTNCSGKVCKHAGKISASGASLICVPNKIAVKIESEKTEELDGVAG